MSALNDLVCEALRSRDHELVRVRVTRHAARLLREWWESFTPTFLDVSRSFEMNGKLNGELAGVLNGVPIELDDSIAPRLFRFDYRARQVSA